ncbi:MAG: hypothetical protein IT429_24455 [Gemmataceae bacterium]|nr:hypothetical protein [Gemmataceae bacterium]
MRKVLLGGFVLLLLLLVRGAAPEPVEAQAKKGGAAGVIEVGEGKDGKFRFFVRDGDGKLLAMSGPGGFASVKEAEAAVDRLKEVVSKAKVAILKKDSKKTKKDK